jgi:hypothetical protein
MIVTDKIRLTREVGGIMKSTDEWLVHPDVYEDVHKFFHAVESTPEIYGKFRDIIKEINGRNGRMRKEEKVLKNG